MKRLHALTFLVTLVSGAAFADQLSDIVPPMPGASQCWQRTYDDTHLAKHPRQKVTEIYFRMEFRDFPDMQDVDPDYFFDTVITTRERRGSNGGPCYIDSGKVNCLIECDGGGFVVRDIRADGAILLDLETRGGIALNSNCGEGEETYFLSAEPDDRLFLLRSGDPKVCEAQFQTVN